MTGVNDKMPGPFFKIYNNASVRDVRMKMNPNSSDQLYEMYRIDSYTGHTALETIEYHRNILRMNEDYVPHLFIIIDRMNLKDEGVLVVNLEPEHGYIDGLRRKAAEAADIIASLEIYNETWDEDRDNCRREKTLLNPFDWFAVYNLLQPTAEEQKSFRSALFYLDDGVSSLGYGSDWEGFGDDEKRKMVRQYYHPVEMKGVRDLDQIATTHGQYAEANDVDPTMFVVIDETQWEEKGILFVKVTPDGVIDKFRRKGPTTGEMLNWIFIGLMTWEEAKNWDSSSIVNE